MNAEILKAGAKARVKNTAMVVDLKKVSHHGMSLITFRTGGDYIIANKRLLPVSKLH